MRPSLDIPLRSHSYLPLELLFTIPRALEIKADAKSRLVMNRLDPIEELYDMYSEKEDTPRIVELGDDGLDFVSDIEGLADPYMDL